LYHSRLVGFLLHDGAVGYIEEVDVEFAIGRMEILIDLFLATVVGGGSGGCVAVFVGGGSGGGSRGVVVGLLVLVSGLHAASQHHCAAQCGYKKQSFHSSKNFIGFFLCKYNQKSKKIVYFALKLKKNISFAIFLVV
jgi:hypothetical protein